MSDFKEHFEYYNCDDRAVFANSIFKLIYQKYKGNFTNPLMLDECSKMDGYLDEHVRNIYEVVDSEIPMIAYIQVLTDGANGYGEWQSYTQSEALNIIKSYCDKYYS